MAMERGSSADASRTPVARRTFFTSGEDDVIEQGGLLDNAGKALIRDDWRRERLRELDGIVVLSSAVNPDLNGSCADTRGDRCPRPRCRRRNQA